MEAEPFITGSHAYGTPGPDSDLDVCMLFDSIDAIKKFSPFADDAVDLVDGYHGRVGASLRFGNLNLLCFADEPHFIAWRDATQELVARRPVTREEAIRTIEHHEQMECQAAEDCL